MPARVAAFRKQALASVLPLQTSKEVVIDSAINSSIASLAKLAFGFDRLIAGYNGNTANLARSSDNLLNSFGTTTSGRFDIDRVRKWADGSAVKLVSLIDQTGSGRIHNYPTTPQLMGSSGNVTRFGTDWNSSDGQLARSTVNGGIGINYNGTSDYGETTASGLDPTGTGFEIHMLSSFNTRKVGNSDVATDPLSGNFTAEILYGYSTTSLNKIYERHCSGTSLYFGNRNGTDTSGTSQNLLNTGTGVTTQPVLRFKKYSTRVSTLSLNDSVMERWELGSKIGRTVTSAGNVTANASMINGLFRTGRGSAVDTSFANILFGAIIVTAQLTDNQRWLLHKRLEATAQQHRLADIKNVVGLFDEWVDFRDINPSTGVITGKKGKLTVNFATGGSTNWDFAYTVKDSALVGVRNPSPASTVNTFQATTNYFSDAREASVFVFAQSDSNSICDWLQLNNSVDANGMGNGTIGLALGRDHNGPRSVNQPDASRDANGWGGSYGWTDGAGAGISQVMCKYGYKLSGSEWFKTEISTVNTTLTANWGSVFFPLGTVLTAADMLTYTNINPPSPELRTFPANDTTDIGYSGSTTGAHVLTIGSWVPHASYNYSANQATRDPFIKKATNTLYTSTGCGTLASHIDSGISNTVASGNTLEMTSGFKVVSGNHQGQTAPGTQFLWGFLKRALTLAEVETLQINYYKVYTEGY